MMSFIFGFIMGCVVYANRQKLTEKCKELERKVSKKLDELQ